PTPGIRTIADLEKKHGVLAQDQVKTLVFTNGKETILVLVRGDDEAQETKVGKVLGAGFRAAVDTEIKEAMGASPGSLGAVASTLAGKKVTVVADFALRGQTGMTTGANDNGFHFKGVDVERDLKIDTWADVRKVRQGDLSSAGKKLNVSRGIEVGHAFLLGTKYSVALEAKFLDPQGKQQPAVMGCYGIGVTRTLQAVIEVHQDKDGIRWPAAVAPYTVMLVTLDLADPAVQSATDAVIASLEKAGIDYLWDDRDERPGVKFKDADLLGFPWRVTIGAKSVAKGGVEVKCRKTGDDSPGGGGKLGSEQTEKLNYSERFRLVWSRIFFRKRRVLGVTSRYSSSARYSRPRSRLCLSGGLSWMPLPSPWDRILVKFFALQGFTTMSAGRVFSPMIMPA
ncbi:MAG: hypothetical protein EBS97_05790, partial [Verrucomicrobia bacterium]|nr:hypothetical protein [Verrucomicrobiota bacterium]